MIQVTLTQKENPLILKLEGRLDALTASDCEVAIRKHITEHYTNSLYFEVANLEYISSAGLRIFLLLINEYELANRKIGIIAPNTYFLQGIDDHQHGVRMINDEGFNLLGQSIR